MDRKRRALPVLAAACALMLLLSSAARPEGTTKSVEDISAALDTVWVLVAATLVFFMQAGFFFLEGGLARAKNVSNAMDSCLDALVYRAIGFAVMFGVDRAGFGEANGLPAVNGLLFGGGFEQLGLQALGSAATAAWAAGTALVMFLVMMRFLGLRVSDGEQLMGLDLAEHNIEAHPEFLPLTGKKGAG